MAGKSLSESDMVSLTETLCGTGQPGQKKAVAATGCDNESPLTIFFFQGNLPSALVQLTVVYTVVDTIFLDTFLCEICINL